MSFDQDQNQNIIRNTNKFDFVSTIFRIVLILLVFLTPLFFLPTTSNFYFAKNAGIIFFGGIIFLIGLKNIFDFANKRVSFSLGKTGFWLMLFTISTLISIWLNPNSMQYFIRYGLQFIFFFLIYISIVNSKDRKLGQLVLYSLAASSTVLAIFTVFLHTGLTNMLGGNEIFTTKAFSPFGSNYHMILFFLLTILLGGFLALKQKNILIKISVFVMLAWQIAAMTLTALWLFSKEANLQFLPWQSAWSIAVDSFKTKPLFGYGPNNFLTPFTLFRPAFLNTLQNIWNWNFGNSSNQYFHLLPTLGLVGFVLFMLILWQIINKAKTYINSRKLSKPIFIGLILIFTFGLISVFEINFWILFVVFLALLESSTIMQIKSFSLHDKNIRRILNLFIFLLVTGVLASWFLVGRTLAADIYWQKARKQIANNKGLETYNFQSQAIRLNESNIEYRIAFSNTNYLLATSLASKEAPTDQEKKQISALVSQAIREAKVAVNLEPQSAYAWQNLAQLYRNLINFAEGAEQWAIAAYQQTIRLNPSNPVFRIELGSIYYNLKNYETAIDLFKQAVELKPDYANAYYNLAIAYKDREEYQKAYWAMQQVLDLVPIESEDFTKVSQELEELENLAVPEGKEASTSGTQNKSGSELSRPGPLPESPKSGQIKLPEEAGLDNLPIEEEATGSAESAEAEPPTDNQ